MARSPFGTAGFWRKLFAFAGKAISSPWNTWIRAIEPDLAGGALRYTLLSVIMLST
jgi:hypothetical protein